MTISSSYFNVPGDVQDRTVSWHLPTGSSIAMTHLNNMTGSEVVTGQYIDLQYMTTDSTMTNSITNVMPSLQTILLSLLLDHWHFEVFNATFAIICFVILILVFRCLNRLSFQMFKSRFVLKALFINDMVLCLGSGLGMIAVIPSFIDAPYEDAMCTLFYLNANILDTASATSSAIMLILAIDQFLAVFLPMHFRISDGKIRRIIYSFLIFIPVVVHVSLKLVYPIITHSSVDFCAFIVIGNAMVDSVSLYYNLIHVLGSIGIYLIIFIRIRRGSQVLSENKINLPNLKRLIRTFFFLTLTLSISRVPAQIFFQICGVNEWCYNLDTYTISYTMHAVYMLKCFIEPVVCAWQIKGIQMQFRHLYCGKLDRKKYQSECETQSVGMSMSETVVADDRQAY